MENHQKWRFVRENPKVFLFLSWDVWNSYRSPRWCIWYPSNRRCFSVFGSYNPFIDTPNSSWYACKTCARQEQTSLGWMMLKVSSYLCFYESEVIHIDILPYWHHGFNCYYVNMWIATVKNQNLYWRYVPCFWNIWYAPTGGPSIKVLLNDALAVLRKKKSQTCEPFRFWIPGRSGVCSLVPNDDGLLKGPDDIPLYPKGFVQSFFQGQQKCDDLW